MIVKDVGDDVAGGCSPWIWSVGLSESFHLLKERQLAQSSFLILDISVYDVIIGFVIGRMNGLVSTPVRCAQRLPLSAAHKIQPPRLNRKTRKRHG
jgi:hypothetical protein